MPMHRANKSTAVRADNLPEDWFLARKRRERAKAKATKKAKRKQRK